MWVGVASLFPETFAALTAQGVVARAIGAGILTLSFENPREHAHDRHRTVDDRPYGGGPGMVMKTEPLKAAVAALAARAPVRPRRIYLSPQGQTLDQMRVEALAREPALLFIAGRYEGVDERFVESEIDEELSLGDFVLTGGELPIMVILDAVARHLPGVLGNAESATMESHRDGLLDCPHYTRPEDVAGRVVPAELLGGDHEVIRRWRLKMALGRTFERRPDLLLRRVLAAEERELLRTFLAERAGGAAAQRRESTHA